MATALLFLIPLAGTATGCGAGSGGGGSPTGSGVPVAQVTPPAPIPEATPTPTPPPAAVPSPPSPPDGPLVPNYNAELTMARQWNKSAVTVAVLSPPAGSAAGGADTAALVRQAVDLWNSKVSQEVRLQMVNENAAADVTIRWTPFSDLPADAVGLTEVTYRSSDNILSSARVRIQESLPESYQVQVIAHELGHCLGIDGHSQDHDDLMYPSAHLPAAVTVRDQNTVLNAYETGRGVAVPQSRIVPTKTIVQYICCKPRHHGSSASIR
ncbi:MAG: matrixin family metalloprotease [Armatimonadota bacterium]